MNIVNIIKKKGGCFVKTSEGREQPLNPETLDSDALGQVMCAVKGQEAPVAFDESAKEKLIRFSKAREGYWGLVVGGLFYAFMVVGEKGLGFRGQVLEKRGQGSGIRGQKKKKTKKKKTEKKRPQRKQKAKRK